jgi:peptidoglycan/xylan/chitin deacetylase (PgdA/CDA1 family)
LTRADAFNQALDWNMIREMAGSRLATFGGHTVSHPLLRQLDRASLVAEIEGCRHRLREAGGVELAYFAYSGNMPRSARWSRLSPKRQVSLRPSRHMRASSGHTISRIRSICRA